jgi:hypothetical protein
MATILSCSVRAAPMPPRKRNAKTTTRRTDGTRQRRRRCRLSTTGVKRKVRRNASATGIRTFCAREREAVTRTIPPRMTKGW